MAEHDMHCDGCGLEVAELHQYDDPRVALLLCWDCWVQLHQAEGEQGYGIPDGCADRFLFYRWLRLNGKIGEGIEEDLGEPVAA